MALKDIVDIMLKINASAYSFEAANPRHEHEYHVFERIKLPDGKILIPGVISHTTNLVDTPNWSPNGSCGSPRSSAARTSSREPTAALPPPP